MNYFQLYGIAESFDVDLTALAQTYQKLQQATHPDRFATQSSQQRLLAVQKNAEVNDAYQVLKSPLSRAEYLLQLRGLDLQHEQQTIKDTAFLMQQMEWRETLMDIDSAANPEAELTAFDQLIVAQIEQQQQALAAALLLEEEEGNSQAADWVRKLKFMYKLRQAIDAKEDALFD